MKKHDMIKELTLMLMYLTSWEESLMPGLRRKPDRTGMQPVIRYSWKGYDFGILSELTEEGLVKSERGKSPAVFTDNGVTMARELLAKYDIDAK